MKMPNNIKSLRVSRTTLRLIDATQFKAFYYKKPGFNATPDQQELLIFFAGNGPEVKGPKMTPYHPLSLSPPLPVLSTGVPE